MNKFFERLLCRPRFPSHFFLSTELSNGYADPREAICAALRTLATNSTVKELILAENQLNDQDGKVSVENGCEQDDGLQSVTF